MNKKTILALGIVVVLVVFLALIVIKIGVKPASQEVNINKFKVKEITLSSNGNMLEVTAKSTSRETLFVHNFTKGHGSCTNGNISVLQEETKATTFSKGELYTFILDCPSHIINNEGSFDVHYHTADDANIREINIVFDFDPTD